MRRALLLCLVVCAFACDSATIRDDEEVVFLPGFAVEAGPSAWTAHVHGWIFEPGDDETMLPLLNRVLLERLELRRDDLDSTHFPRRARMFLVDNERSKRIGVDISGRVFTLAPSQSNGHFEDRIALKGTGRRSGEWIAVRAATRPGDKRVFAGRVQLIGRRGVSVVSDIDDTIKISNVLDRRELGKNTFVREFRAAPGMADLYRAWAVGGDVVFHYVSGSPWQLYPPLADFVRRDGFPEGTFHLRGFRLKDSSAAEFVENRTLDYKLGVIDPLMRLFPERRFILVGDSGEQDPEVYAELASRFEKQVAAIVIRDVRQEDLNSPRFVQLFSKLPAHIERRVFRNTRELADLRLPVIIPR